MSSLCNHMLVWLLVLFHRSRAHQAVVEDATAHHSSSRGSVSLEVDRDVLAPTERTLLFHLHAPKCAGTSLSVSLVSDFCPDSDVTTATWGHSKKLVGWETRCQWPCSGKYDEAYGPAALDQQQLEPPRANTSTSQHWKAERQDQVMLDTEFSCMRRGRGVGSSNRREHALLKESTSRARALARYYAAQWPSSSHLFPAVSMGTKVIYVLTLRRGTERAISHWSHCMNEASNHPEWAQCTLGKIALGPYRRAAGGLFSSNSLVHFANSSYSEENYPWFRYSNLQVGMLASIPSSQREWLTDEDLQRAKFALMGLRAPKKSGADKAASDIAVGFVECLPKLLPALKQMVHDEFTLDTAQLPLLQLERQTPNELKISAKARAFVTERNSLDDQLHDWAQRTFPEASCDPVVSASETIPKLSVVHKPAENDQFVDNAVPVSWTASSGSDFLDLHICEEKVIESSQCVLVRSTMSAHKKGGGDIAFTLRIGGEALGRKDWVQLQEPCE